MSRNKLNTPTKPAAVVADPVAAKAPDVVKSDEPNGKVQVHSTTGGTFINPFTQEEIGSEPVTVTNDGWLKSQIDAKKIEQV